MRFRNFFVALRYTLALLAVVLIGLTVTLFIVFPRVVNWLADILGTGAENPVHWVPAIIIDLVLIILAIVWVWMPFERFRIAQRAQGLVVRRGQGRAYIDTESVRQQIYAAVAKIPAVQRAEVSVTNDLGRAVVVMNILTDNAINGPKKKQEVSREVKKVIEDQLGVDLASEPTINMSLTPVAAAGSELPPLAKPPTVLSSPRTVSDARPAPEVRAATVVTAPPPAPSPVTVVVDEPPAPKPVEDTEPVSTVIVSNQDGPRNPLESPPQALTSSPDNTDTPPYMPVTPRPFARRPFVPPGGSTTLPELPAAPARSEPPADTPPDTSGSDTSGSDAAADNSQPDSSSAADGQDQASQSV